VLSGWAFDSRKPNEGVEVEVLLGDKPADRSQGRPPARRPVAVWDRQRPSRLRGRHRRRSAFQHGPGSHSRHRLLPAQRPREGRATQRGAVQQLDARRRAHLAVGFQRAPAGRRRRTRLRRDHRRGARVYRGRRPKLSERPSSTIHLFLHPSRPLTALHGPPFQPRSVLFFPATTSGLPLGGRSSHLVEVDNGIQSFTRANPAGA